MWASDFVFDACVNDQQLKCLTMIDEFTRKALAIDVAGSIRSARVKEVLAKLISVHRARRYLRSDNGSEFLSRAILKWLATEKIETASRVAPPPPSDARRATSAQTLHRDISRGGGLSDRRSSSLPGSRLRPSADGVMTRTPAGTPPPRLELDAFYAPIAHSVRRGSTGFTNLRRRLVNFSSSMTGKGSSFPIVLYEREFLNTPMAPAKTAGIRSRSTRRMGEDHSAD